MMAVEMPYLDRLREIGIVAVFLLMALCLRVFAAFHTSIEVDEPIYRYAAAYTARYGFPSVRAAYQQQTIPFLYHPPFFMFLLAEWFKIWGSDSYFTGRLLSVITSLIMLVILYIFVQKITNKTVALIVLFLIGSDAWILFTNQAIYLENSQMILIILGVEAYCLATNTNSVDRKRYFMRYLITGILIGLVIVYKHIGVFLLISVASNLILQRKHLRGHILLFIATTAVVAVYVSSMQLVFGGLFDYATIVQIHRTLGATSSPGLSYSPITALQAIYSRYWIFPTTIIVLIGGSIFTLIRCVHQVLGKRKGETITLSWALGAIVFALSISLKSPQYMILWLIPLYIFLVKELYSMLGNRTRINKYAVKTSTAILVGITIIINLWSFQMRLFHFSGDILAEAAQYINTNLPPYAIVATEDYVDVDITPQYVNDNFIDTPAKLYWSDATYAAFYWSTTEPLPKSLGNINSYCTPLRTFTGFKDHMEICQLNRTILARFVDASASPNKNANSSLQNAPLLP
ncbi:MAG: glycosyltransferase family 39 protein [Chloroflexi bacterium]|nr:glycosyltransferase family 39 protein [Ktedonobacteraceae bacterium]MBV9705994.1 glycosyltransferase family 39 protein [Chloroflexota bacterium]